MSDILTYTEASQELGIARATISKWVKEGKLAQSSRLGKAKTVARESVEKLLGDELFMRALRLSQKGQHKEKEGTLPKDKVQKLEERITTISQVYSDLASKVLDLERVCQSFQESFGKVTLGKGKKEREKKMEGKLGTERKV